MVFMYKVKVMYNVSVMYRERVMLILLKMKIMLLNFSNKKCVYLHEFILNLPIEFYFIS